MSQPFRRKLRALKYGDWKNFNIANREEIQALVVWLEQTCIRQYAVAERETLKDIKNEKWNEHLQEYLISLESPYTLHYALSENNNNNNNNNKKNNNNNNKSDDIKRKIESEWIYIVDWLLSQAIVREYSDHKNEFNQRKPIRRKDKKIYQLEGCVGKDMDKALEDLCKYLNIPKHPTDNTITCHVIATFIKNKFSPLALKNHEEYLKENKGQSKSQNPNVIKNTDEYDPWKNIQGYKDIVQFYGDTLGFKTGDDKVDAAAIILKYLYLMDIRSAQSQFTEIITFLQRYTADPKTNKDLAKVGW